MTLRDTPCGHYFCAKKGGNTIGELLNLIDERQFIRVRQIVQNENVVDVAEFIGTIDDDPRALIIFRLLPKEMAAEVFAYLDHDIQQKIVEGITDKELAGIVDELFLDDTVDFVEEMPASIVKRVIKMADLDTRQQINQLLMYPDSSAGSIMTIEFMEVDRDWNVRNAIEKIRRQAEDKEAIDTLFVTDEQRRLEGVIGLRDILTGRDDELIGDLMETGVISIKTHDDQALVAEMFKKYDLLTMPVVDNENRLVGLITIDDVIDVIEAETTEDIELMAAITPSDKPYLKTGAVELWKRRIPWLLILMISATFTGIIITRFESALASCVVLTAFIPMLMDTGGNSGSQSSVTVIRGISLGELNFSDMPRIVWKEFRVAIMCGLTLAVCNFVKLMLLDRVSVLVAGVVCFTLVFTVLVAKIVGCILPMVAEKIGFDPAVMASPFITTIVDAISLIIYFQMAALLLGI